MRAVCGLEDRGGPIPSRSSSAGEVQRRKRLPFGAPPRATPVRTHPHPWGNFLPAWAGPGTSSIHLPVNGALRSRSCPIMLQHISPAPIAEWESSLTLIVPMRTFRMGRVEGGAGSWSWQPATGEVSLQWQAWSMGGAHESLRSDPGPVDGPLADRLAFGSRPTGSPKPKCPPAIWGLNRRWRTLTTV